MNLATLTHEDIHPCLPRLFHRLVEVSFTEAAHWCAHEAAGEVGTPSGKRDAANQPVAIKDVHRLTAHFEGTRAIPVPCALRLGQQMLPVAVTACAHSCGMPPCMAAAAVQAKLDRPSRLV